METLTTTELLLLILATICFFGIIMFAIGIYSNKKVTKFFDQSDNQMNEMPTYPTDADYLADMQRKMEEIEQPSKVDTSEIQGLIDAANNQIANSTIKPAKRSHASRKASFSLEQALKDGVAILVDGKSHVYVGFNDKFTPEGTYSVRGLSNGQGYGKTTAEMNGKLECSNTSGWYQRRYLININKTVYPFNTEQAVNDGKAIAVIGGKSTVFKFMSYNEENDAIFGNEKYGNFSADEFGRIYGGHLLNIRK